MIKFSHTDLTIIHLRDIKHITQHSNFFRVIGVHAALIYLWKLKTKLCFMHYTHIYILTSTQMFLKIVHKLKAKTQTWGLILTFKKVGDDKKYTVYLWKINLNKLQIENRIKAQHSVAKNPHDPTCTFWYPRRFQ